MIMNNNSENAGIFTISSFPDYVAANYAYSEVMEAHESDSRAAAEEVREDVAQILRYFRKSLPDDTIAKALERFVSEYPVGQDLDEQMGALGFGLERELGDYMIEEIYQNVTSELRDVIESFLEKYGPDNIGDRTNDRRYLINLSKRLEQEFSFEQDVIVALFRELVDAYSFDIYDSSEFLGRLRRFFESSPCFLDSGLSRSAFLREVLNKQRDPSEFFYNF